MSEEFDYEDIFERDNTNKPLEKPKPKTVQRADDFEGAQGYEGTEGLEGFDDTQNSEENIENKTSDVPAKIYTFVDNAKAQSYIFFLGVKSKLFVLKANYHAKKAQALKYKNQQRKFGSSRPIDLAEAPIPDTTTPIRSSLQQPANTKIYGLIALALLLGAGYYFYEKEFYGLFDRGETLVSDVPVVPETEVVAEQPIEAEEVVDEYVSADDMAAAAETNTPVSPVVVVEPPKPAPVVVKSEQAPKAPVAKPAAKPIQRQPQKSQQELDEERLMREQMRQLEERTR